MSIRQIKVSDFKEIIDIIEEIDETKLNCNIPPWGNSIYLMSKDIETELYIKKGADKLIISRVQFKNKRAGIMTKVLKELINVSQCYGYDKIMVESVLSEAMALFCIKNDFKKLSNEFEELLWYAGNYELEIK